MLAIHDFGAGEIVGQSRCQGRRSCCLCSGHVVEIDVETADRADPTTGAARSVDERGVMSSRLAGNGSDAVSGDVSGALGASLAANR